jgi:hypothetical protein
MKSDKEIGIEAREIARAEVLKECRRKDVNLGLRRVLRKISEGLEAQENKVFYDKDRGKCIVGPDQINWSARQKAVDQAMAILDLKPAEKHDVRVRSLEDVLRELDDDDEQR